MSFNLIRFGSPEKATILLAHGAGAGSDSAFMTAFAIGLAKHGFETILFDFPYMAQMKREGKRRPPDKAPKLVSFYKEIITEVRAPHLIIGGKSMGGRIASMLLAQEPQIANGLLLLGYPFHPPGKPERLRTEHFPHIAAPTLIVQGERDTFGGKALVTQLGLPKNYSIYWCPDGDHSLKPRKASGYSEAGNWQAAQDTIASHDW
ncbi:alpha/beta fold hydrolase [Kordiimonas pumila]|uniref:Alpha/beta fold hydrolase n=1 Tax=Kordiimonas pumila TaxID=2161677 RepID=A0ABV7D570_9PROT|nr:alpha/beta fold hydrolase [Kordiimonas pumila]